MSKYNFTRVLINGCSHSAGSEIEGSGIGDSQENRRRAFGSKLASKLGVPYENISLCGASNDYITRTTIMWILDNPRLAKNSLFLIHWTGTFRTELFYDVPKEQNEYWAYAPYVPDSQVGHLHHTQFANIIPYNYKNNAKVLQKHLFYNQTHWHIQRYLNVIQLQSFLEAHGYPYIFKNAFQSMEQGNRYSYYKKKINFQNFKHFDNEKESFFEHCLDAGFNIEGQEFWHHREGAHDYWADKIFNENFS